MKARIALLLVALVLPIAAMAATETQAAKDVTFVSPMKIGDVLLPPGQYKATHLEEAGQHIMVFRKAGKAGAEFRVKCTLQPLDQKATRTQQYYNVGAGGEHILVGLVFEGDTVRHMFR